MIFYSQSSGHYWNQDGSLEGQDGYSGRGPGLNNGNGSSERVASVGPIPLGRYAISTYACNNGLCQLIGQHTALCVQERDEITFALIPCEGTETYGRTRFRIQGDNVKADRSASDGSIVMPLASRRWIAEHGEKFLEVCA